ncbi:ribose ABC transporter permease, partial [Streptococcus agalactiae]|nr:ribose ABC transporter permease [Streptococcus agalactiae]MCC9730908.1 ribose ABC transporter permease [Streptococcus agalactiae]MCC9747179.1 ribose ABC transporter permease [Streptococcus agalactiae]MCC9750448.1 ribose ABC transporter permease [Streptococcus agalactiae]MCC9754415.1 ribose ABC transporter permease [Streptococcus agalactiae]
MKNMMKYISELTTLIALAGLMVIITLINPNFLTTNNLLN